MNTIQPITVMLFLLLSLGMSSCASAQLVAPTATSTPMPTVAPTNTPTPLPTLTPTATLPPTPVPEMGKPLVGADWQVILKSAVVRPSIVFYSFESYRPKKGFILVDVLTKVKNLNPSTNASIVVRQLDADPKKHLPEFFNAFDLPSTKVSDTVLIDDNGETIIPDMWGSLGAFDTYGKDIDPALAGIQGIFQPPPLIADASGSQHYTFTMSVENESYLRFIYALADTSLGKTISYKFRDLPAIPFIINK